MTFTVSVREFDAKRVPSTSAVRTYDVTAPSVDAAKQMVNPVEMNNPKVYSFEIIPKESS